jgi:hypothetical protein
VYDSSEKQRIPSWTGEHHTKFAKTDDVDRILYKGQDVRTLATYAGRH